MTVQSTVQRVWEQSMLRAALAHGYRWVRHLPERQLHASRRTRAIATVAAAPHPQRVLFICLGNVCRSPYAEVASRRDAALWGTPAPAWRSAGFIGPNRSAPLHAIAVAAERGAPLDAHRSQLVSPALVAESDLIVVMGANQASELALLFGRRAGVVVLGDFDPHPIAMRTIADPWNKARVDFEASYERIDRCLAALAAVLRSLQPTPSDRGAG